MHSSQPRIAALLAVLAAIGPFAIDTYLPAFPAMAQALGATQLQVQQTLTIYMVTFAGMALWHGALSDSFGRRRVVLVSTSLFGLASLVCADRKSTRLNSSHVRISYAVFCLKKK